MTSKLAIVTGGTRGITPMQRWALPEEIGEVVTFLCSPKAAFITGAALPVDGGLHLK